MKPLRSTSKSAGLCAVLLSIALALVVSSASAQNVTVSFPTNSAFATNGLTGVWSWWGSATTVRAFDPTEDASGDGTSGSIKITATWPASGGDQYSVGLALSG